MRSIIDVTLGSHELDIFEIRAMTLLGTSPTRDVWFLIAEADETFSGKSKPRHFRQRLDTKIERWYVDPSTHMPVYGDPWDHFRDRVDTLHIRELKGGNAWEKERYTRRTTWEHAKTIASTLYFNHLLFGDMDEIPHPAALDLFVQTSESQPFVMFEHDMFYYSPRYKFETIGGTRGVRRDKLPHDVHDPVWDGQRLRETVYPVIGERGWHYSYFGSLDEVKLKLQSYAHTELNRKDIIDSLEVKRRDGLDIADRAGMRSTTIDPLERMPQYLRENYPYFNQKWGIV